MDEILDEINNRLFECQHCGLWIDIKKEINGMCKPCSKEVEDYE